MIDVARAPAAARSSSIARVDDRRRHHQADRARARELLARAPPATRCRPRPPRPGLRPPRRPVVHDARVSGAHQPPHHVGAHPAEPDHAELHGHAPARRSWLSTVPSLLIMLPEVIVDGLRCARGEARVARHAGSAGARWTREGRSRSRCPAARWHRPSSRGWPGCPWTGPAPTFFWGDERAVPATRSGVELRPWPARSGSTRAGARREHPPDAKPTPRPRRERPRTYADDMRARARHAAAARPRAPGRRTGRPRLLAVPRPPAAARGASGGWRPSRTRPKPPPRRLTLTLPALEAAELVVVAAFGCRQGRGGTRRPSTIRSPSCPWPWPRAERGERSSCSIPRPATHAQPELGISDSSVLR